MSNQGGGGQGGGGQSSGGQGNQGNQPNKKSNPNISDMILGGLKSRAGKDTSNWLTNLGGGGKEGAREAIEQEAANQQVPPRHSAQVPSGKGSIVGWVDKIFDNFAQYEVEFNRAVSGTELTVSVERPEYSNPESFRGRLSTRQWTLILRNNKGIIEGYFLPCDKMIAFSINEHGFTRILQMKPGYQDDQSCYLVGDRQTPVLYSQVPYFSKQLFGALIRVAKGEGSDQEEFIWMPPSPVPERTPNRGEFDSARTADSEMPAIKPGQPAPQPVAEGLPSMRATTQSGTHQLQGQVPYVQPRPQGGSDFERPPMTLVEAFDNVLRSMEIELENLAQLGSSAFEQKDQEQVDKIMRKTNKVKAYRERLRGAITEWKSILASED
jgi:hypothetical protein